MNQPSDAFRHHASENGETRRGRLHSDNTSGQVGGDLSDRRVTDSREASDTFTFPEGTEFHSIPLDCVASEDAVSLSITKNAEEGSRFPEETTFEDVPEDDTDPPEQSHQQTSGISRNQRLLVIASTAAVLILVLLHVSHSAYRYALELAETSYGFFWCFVGSLSLLTICMTILLVRQLRRYHRIQQLSDFRQDLVEWQEGAGTLGEKQLRDRTAEWIEYLAKNKTISEVTHSVVLERNAQATDLAEWLGTLETEVLADMDMRAKNLIEAEARAVGMSTAISPYGIIDAFFVLWRNSRLVLRIAQVYGGRPGWLGSLRLVRRVLANVAIGGLSQESLEIYDSVRKVKAVGAAAEGVSATGKAVATGGTAVTPLAPLIGAPMAVVGTTLAFAGGFIGKLTGQLSGPVLQGFLTGILTIRMGLAAQEQCRLVPMTTDKYKERAAGLFSALHGMLPKAKRKKTDEDMDTERENENTSTHDG